MLDALREEEIVNKVGGRFRLSTLIQKRLVALNAGARPLVTGNLESKMEIVIQTKSTSTRPKTCKSPAKAPKGVRPNSI
jgi:hypothetical protein